MKKYLLIFLVLFGLYDVAHAMDVKLACDPNSESDLAGYRIYWSQTSGQYSNENQKEFPLTSITPATPEFLVTGLDETKGWYFVATAYDTEGLESDYSNEVYYKWDGVSGIPPQPPSGLQPLQITIVRPDGTTVAITVP
jgi:hypothetical protein